jgi:hypothetical protein
MSRRVLIMQACKRVCIRLLYSKQQSTMPAAACLGFGCMQDTAGPDMRQGSRHEPGQHAEGADELRQLPDEEVRRMHHCMLAAAAYA